MKRSEFKQSIREEIIDILEAASNEEVDNAKELNKELEKTANIVNKIDLSEGNDTDKFMDDGYVDHKYDDSTIDKYNIPVAQTAVFEEDDDEPSSKDIKASSKDSISKIASKLQQISSEMKSTAKKWKASEGDEKMKLRDRLVKLTKIKKELESLL